LVIPRPATSPPKSSTRTSGNPEDYELLRKKRHQRERQDRSRALFESYSYRGFKALTAEREGAAALLIYSDPAEDGSAPRQSFSDGPWARRATLQRGAITYDYIVPGDPTTPLGFRFPAQKHIAPEEARSLPKIPALPLSWRDAKRFSEMNGPEAPKDWQGALPITYRFTGAVRVHVKIDMETSMQSYTVVKRAFAAANFPTNGAAWKYRDAWVYGAVDPSAHGFDDGTNALSW